MSNSQAILTGFGFIAAAILVVGLTKEGATQASGGYQISAVANPSGNVFVAWIVGPAGQARICVPGNDTVANPPKCSPYTTN